MNPSRSFIERDLAFDGDFDSLVHLNGTVRFTGGASSCVTVHIVVVYSYCIYSS
jgi:hypothetical protein